MASSTLIDQWHEQLRETEELIVHGSPQLRWLRIAYARLYRFLLSAYGVVPIDGRDETADPAAGREGLTIDDSVDFQGKPARTGAEIRTALQSVHGAKEEVEAGPLQLGLHGTDWIIVATLDQDEATEFHRRLDEARIACRMTRKGNQAILEVTYRDREVARTLLPEPSTTDPAFPPSDRRQASPEPRTLTATQLLTRFFTSAGLILAIMLLGMAAIQSWMHAAILAIFLAIVGLSVVCWNLFRGDQ